MADLFILEYALGAVRGDRSVTSSICRSTNFAVGSNRPFKTCLPRKLLGTFLTEEKLRFITIESAYKKIQGTP